MIDRASAFQSRYGGWGPILRKLQADERPTPKEVASILRAAEITGMPEPVKNYIAGLLDGTVKLKRGHKKQDSFSVMATRVAVLERYGLEREKIAERRKDRTAS
jgi:hypothetical protein